MVFVYYKKLQLVEKTKNFKLLQFDLSEFESSEFEF